MDDLNVLVTGAGAPGISGTLYSLKNNYDKRKIRIIGTDIKDDVIGKYLLDSFYLVSDPSKEKDFIDKIIDICETEEIKIILPQTTNELPVFAKNKKSFDKKEIKIGVSSFENIIKANNKFLLSETAKKIGCPFPKYALVKNWDEFEEALTFFNYPEKPIVIKPPVSSGMRGLRIIGENIDRFNLWKNEKPTGIYLTKEEFQNIFVGNKFPELMVTEYLPGEEYTVDALAIDGKSIITVPRKRLQIRTGITFKSITEKNEKMIRYSNLLTKELKLSYAFGYQFKLDENNEPKILECNPRIQGTMIASTISGANIIYSAVKLLNDEQIPSFRIEWGTKFLRYWGGISVLDDKILEKI